MEIKKSKNILLTHSAARRDRSMILMDLFVFVIYPSLNFRTKFTNPTRDRESDSVFQARRNTKGTERVGKEEDRKRRQSVKRN
jgi:hypothetical protein